MLNRIKTRLRKLFTWKLFTKKRPRIELNREYTNQVSFLDIDRKTIHVKTKHLNGHDYLYIFNNKGDVEFAFDEEAALFLSSILSDYIENGNLHKIEEILGANNG